MVHYFNPRSPCGERPKLVFFLTNQQTFQSTLPVWGATLVCCILINIVLISIHAPRVGSDACFRTSAMLMTSFQSTLPVWGATTPYRSSFPGYSHFNPRSPCGERQGLFFLVIFDLLFQSTLPVWGATANSMIDTGKDKISIHAPRVGSDSPGTVFKFLYTDFNPRSPCGERRSTRRTWHMTANFNPRSPCGERHLLDVVGVLVFVFQSTLPVWGATAYLSHIQLHD